MGKFETHQNSSFWCVSKCLVNVICRGDRIRTCDHLVPNQVRYRTALRPEFVSAKLRKIFNICTIRYAESGLKTILLGFFKLSDTIFYGHTQKLMPNLSTAELMLSPLYGISKSVALRRVK